MKIKDVWQKFLFVCAVGISIFLLFFVIVCVWIGYDVKNQCYLAKKQYDKKDCVSALSTLLDDDRQGFRSRNSAIWALGQLGDKRALPILEKYYTGDIPNREPLDKTISQYELKKAVKLARGGLNITAFVWRNNLQ